MKQKILKKALKENTLVGMRTIREEWDETIIGFVAEINKDSLIINEIDKYGFDAGLTELEIEDIIHIDINDRYQKRLNYLINNRGLLDKSKTKTIWKKGEKLLPHIHSLIEEKKITTLYLDEDNYIIGIILEYEKPDIKIKCIGKQGDDDGISYYLIDNLTGLRYDGLDEQKIKLLYETNDY